MSTTIRQLNDEDRRLQRAICLVPPRTPDQLHGYIRSVFGFRMPRVPLIAGHSAPFDYLQHSFFEDQHIDQRDCIVWANRGGGKTQIAAIATLLDLIFKPGIQVRILGGSLDQSARMYRYLKQLLIERGLFDDLIAGKFTGRFVELTNGSRVEVLSQSERAVRGQRVHKLRCDEVELFDRDVWEAAQLVTRSGQCGDVHVRAAIEVLSTMHEPYGLMRELVSNAQVQRRRVFRWSVLDVLQHCEAWRSCGKSDLTIEPGEQRETSQSICPLWQECQGRAKDATVRGFMSIDDAIQHKRRVGEQTWIAEMLCDQPSRSNCVYPEFDRAVHIVDDHQLQDLLQRTRLHQRTTASPHKSRIKRSSLHNRTGFVPTSTNCDGFVCVGGLDFGFRDPTVLLWAIIDDEGVITVVDEFIQRGWTADEFIDAAIQRSSDNGFGIPQWVGADPAGHQRSEQTGISTITAWQRAGWTLRTRILQIEPGIDAVRRRFRRADGFIGLRIHHRCEQLIEAITEYHYPADRPETAPPEKDGHDHAADALRYMITNIGRETNHLKTSTYLYGSRPGPVR